MTQSSRLAEHARSRPRVSPASRSDADVSALRVRLMALAIKLVWNRDDAEELVQEAFKIAAAGGPAVVEARYEPWMLRTVGNLCMNLRRRRKPEPIASWLELDANESPGDRLERAERLEGVRQALEQLPDQQRLAVVLRMMERADYSRIADVLNVSESAARTHVHLGRKRLMEALSDAAGSEKRGDVS